MIEPECSATKILLMTYIQNLNSLNSAYIRNRSCHAIGRMSREIRLRSEVGGRRDELCSNVKRYYLFKFGDVVNVHIFFLFARIACLSSDQLEASIR